MIAKAASALFYDIAVWYLVWVCGRVGVCVCGGMNDAMGSSTGVKLFRLSFSTGSPSRKTQSKKVESIKPFFDCCVRKPDLGFSRNRPFSTDKSDWVRNGLRSPGGIHNLDGHVWCSSGNCSLYFPFRFCCITLFGTRVVLLLCSFFLFCFSFFFSLFFSLVWSGLFCCVLVLGTLALPLLYLAELRLFGLLCLTVCDHIE